MSLLTLRHLVCLIGLYAVTIMQVHATPAAPARLDAVQVRADVELARKAYSRIHPGYTRYATAADLDRAWQSIINDAEANNGIDVSDFYLAVQRVLTLIRCDHTKAELPATLVKLRKTEPVYLPVRLDVVERRGFVRIAGPDSTLQVSDEILSIDHRPFAEVLAAVEVYVPYDGHTVWSRNSGVAESLEFMGGAIDHFGALLWSVPPVASLEIRRRSADGQLKQLNIEVARVTFDGWTALNDSLADQGDDSSNQQSESVQLDPSTLIESLAGVEGQSIHPSVQQQLALPKRVAANFKDALIVRRIGQRIAYLRVDSFVNYREPVDPDDLYVPIFKAFKKERRDILILDLRNNGGGSNDAQHGLLEHLISKPIYPAKDMRVATLELDDLRDHLWTWDKRALKPNRLGFRRNDDGTYSLRRFLDDSLKKAKPAKYRFEGHVMALTSNANSSGTTNLLAVLKAHRDITLIGEKTGGSAEGVTAGLLFTLTLPNSQIKMRIPFFLTYNNVDSFAPGLGLTPNIEVTRKAVDWSPDYDPVLTRALALAFAKLQ